MTGTQNSTQNVTNFDKKTVLLIVSLVLSIFTTIAVNQGWITPQQRLILNAETESMIQQLMPDLNLTYQQVVNGLTLEVGSSLSGLAGSYTYMIAHPLGDNSITAIKNGTTGAWDYWRTDAGLCLNYSIYHLPRTFDGMYYGNIIFTSGLFVAHTLVAIPQNSSISIKGLDIGATQLIWNGTGILSYSDDPSHYAISYTSPFCIMDNGTYGGSQPVKSISQSLTIRDLTIDTSQSQYVGGIYLHLPALIDFESIRVIGYYAVNQVEPTQYIKGIFWDTSLNNFDYSMTHVFVYGFYNGVILYGDHYNVNDLQVTNCKVSLVIYRATSSTITGFAAYRTWYWGINFDITSDTVACEIINPRVEGTLDGTAQYECQYIGAPFQALIENAQFNVGGTVFGGTWTPSSVTWTGIGFVTSGSSLNTTATTCVVSHGLAGTPNAGITALCNDTGITELSVTAQSTITITFTESGTPTGNWTTYYNAQYHP